MTGESSGRRSVDERRQQLVEAAAEVIAADGLGQATTRRITDHAGLALGIFHDSFGSKDDLLEAVIEDVGSEVEAALRDAVTEPDRGIETALCEIVEAAWQTVDDRPTQQLARHELTVHALRDDALRPVAIRQYERFAEAVVDTLEDVPDAPGGDTLEDLARFVVATVDGLALQRFVHPDRDAANRRVQLYLRLLSEDPLPAAAASRAS